MININVLDEFIQKITNASVSSIEDLDGAKNLYLALEKARKKYEGKLFNMLYPLSQKKQAALLKNLMSVFKTHSGFFIQLPQWLNFRPEHGPTTQYFKERLANVKTLSNDKTLKDLAKERQTLRNLIEQSKKADEITRSRYYSYDYLFWLLHVRLSEKPDDSGADLSEQEQKRLVKKIVSAVYHKGYENTRNYYASVAQSGIGVELIIDSRLKLSLLEQEKIKLGAEEPPISSVMPDSNQGGNPVVTMRATADSDNPTKSAPLLKWLGAGGAGDLTELFYRLERSGFIDLKTYKAAGGNLSELSRRLCYVFDFKGGNPIGNLTSYLSKLKDSDLGPGPLEETPMMAIDRKKGGRMSIIVPDL